MIIVLVLLFFVLAIVFVVGYFLAKARYAEKLKQLEYRCAELKQVCNTLEVAKAQAETKAARMEAEVEKLRHETEEAVKKARREAVAASRGVLAGKIGERIAPLFPRFPVAPEEVSFVNFGIDYIGFPGYKDRNVQEVVLIEVKTGSSQLGPIQSQIKRCVQEGKVRFVVYRPDEAVGFTEE